MVSRTGHVGMAAPVSRAARSTRSIKAGDTSTRATSCTATNRSPRSGAPGEAAVERLPKRRRRDYLDRGLPLALALGYHGGAKAQARRFLQAPVDLRHGP